MFTKFMLVASVLVLAAGSADAAPTARPTRDVSYSDLDVSTKSGADALLARINSAARSVCSSLAARSLTAAPLHDACMRDAIDGAVAQIRSPRVAGLARQ